MVVFDIAEYHGKVTTIPVSGLAGRNCLAEDTAEYKANRSRKTKSPRVTEFSQQLEHIKQASLAVTADAHLGYLLQLANVLDQPAASDRSAIELAALAQALRDAIGELERVMHGIDAAVLKEN